MMGLCSVVLIKTKSVYPRTLVAIDKKSPDKLSRPWSLGITLALREMPSVANSVLALTNDTW